MQNLRKIISQKIKESRKVKKMTQYELANAVCVDPKYISRIETGMSYPSLSIVEKIFDVLEVDFNNFIDSENTIEKSEIISLITSNLKSISVKNLRLIKDIVDLMVTKL